jgi:transcriptional regulator with XRE-family HTH domain
MRRPLARSEPAIGHSVTRQATKCSREAVLCSCWVALDPDKGALSATCFDVHMSPTKLQRAADRRTSALRDDLVDQLAQLRSYAAITVRDLARAAGLSAPYVARILAKTERPTLEAYGRLAAVLGADLGAKFYTNTGPAIHDRHQAPILECLLRDRDPRWHPFTEIAVQHPRQGWIDVGFHDRRAGIFVATEIQGALPRLEQLVRWSAAKADSVRSWDGWRHLGDEPAVSRLLVVRRTRATRQIAADFAEQLRVAYPAHPDDAIASLTETAPWPGAAMVWSVIEHGRARLVPGR